LRDRVTALGSQRSPGCSSHARTLGVDVHLADAVTRSRQHHSIAPATSSAALLLHPK
jgi:hypothetical protein